MLVVLVQAIPLVLTLSNSMALLGCTIGHAQITTVEMTTLLFNHLASKQVLLLLLLLQAPRCPAGQHGVRLAVSAGHMAQHGTAGSTTGQRLATPRVYWTWSSTTTDISCTGSRGVSSGLTSTPMYF